MSPEQYHTCDLPLECSRRYLSEYHRVFPPPLVISIAVPESSSATVPLSHQLWAQCCVPQRLVRWGTALDELSEPDHGRPDIDFTDISLF
jgi:hypothetical protein